MMQRPLLALSLATLLVGCNLVPITPEGEAVRVITADEAKQCERLGKTTVRVLAKVLFVSRRETTMSEELLTLARNAAVGMDGNSVAPESPIAEGSQSFGVHRCP